MVLLVGGSGRIEGRSMVLCRHSGTDARRYLPVPVVGLLLVLLIGCPIFHLFTECLLFGKYFEQLNLAMPILVIEKL